MQGTLLTYLYLIPVLVIVIWYWSRHKRLERESFAALKAATEAGMLEPPTLHPDIDPRICIGCKSCVEACPEQDAHAVLGMIGKKAWLVGPSDCIGHGACKTACPVGAITLVFGTSTRGIDIPVVKPNFETDVPGIFIAGELGGMGLIRNAIEQGRQAMESIIKLLKTGHNNQHDLVIIGAGPAGFAATLAAKAANLKSVTVEQEELGGTVAHFPRRKLVMTQPAELPIVGKMKFREVQKEELIDFWKKVENDTAVKINYDERVDAIEPAASGSGYVVTTDKTTYDTRAVLIAIGRRGSPRQLGVPGEDLPKVTYRLIDPEQYQNLNVLVVGGGDSALEAATSIAEELGTIVTLSYRSAAFSRAKPKNRDKVEAMRSDGRLRVLLNSNVKEIRPDSVVIAVGEKIGQLKNDAVIISAGGILPSMFLKKIGINVETKWGTE
ncbi:MAG: NAD(P)-binding domain-containing protein [Gammaproteobacteria bacterium]|nr:NAD(P)-binding domain-containing protein [Gammaproteobacteria bacterium]MDH3372903.1 NAD(P)-binding domain-containing protein [Gammaproteobacteria bacterium]MDH3552693.1 NAD(P)-binding domain-containing protein [Gammaproteobacteria bacterium]